MNLQINVNNFVLTDKIKKLIDNKLALKLDRLLKHFNPDLKTAQLHLQRGKLGFYTASFDMLLPGKEKIYAQATHLILGSTLINLQHKIAKQILRHKK